MASASVHRIVKNRPQSGVRANVNAMRNSNSLTNFNPLLNTLPSNSHVYQQDTDSQHVSQPNMYFAQQHGAYPTKPFQTSEVSPGYLQTRSIDSKVVLTEPN